jgi:hypothetical protein
MIIFNDNFHSLNYILLLDNLLISVVVGIVSMNIYSSRREIRYYFVENKLVNFLLYYVSTVKVIFSED